MKKLILLMLSILLLFSTICAEPVDFKQDTDNIRLLSQMIGQSADEVHRFFDNEPSGTNGNLELYYVKFHGAEYVVCTETNGSKVVHVSLSRRYPNKNFIQATASEYAYLKKAVTYVYGKSDLAQPPTWVLNGKGVSISITLRREDPLNETDKLISVEVYDSEWLDNYY